ncbi:hypothetical protein F441_02954, partial [Phytophthora nicotianae CJ01A1]
LGMAALHIKITARADYLRPIQKPESPEHNIL